MKRKTSLSTLPVLLALLVSGCGGGGDPPVTLPMNQAPQFTSAASATLVENAALSYQATATDPDGNPLTFSIGGGADAARFSISTAGLLNFVAAADFDAPVDADSDNVYQVMLSVSDGRTTASLPLSVTVTNSREGIAVRRIFTGFDKPIAMKAIPGDTRIFVAEQDGNIFYFDPATRTRTLYTNVSKMAPSVFIQMSNIAASPNYASDGLLFVSRKADALSTLDVIERAKVEAGVSPSTTRIHTFSDGFTGHLPFGWLDFGPDGHLYMGKGASFRPSDEDPNADDNFHGKVFRVRRNAPGTSPAYTLEIVAKGLFGPVSATFAGNVLLVGDQGRSVAGEINRVGINAPVSNFGYPYREGATHVYGTAPAGLVDPALLIPHAPANPALPRTAKNLVLGPIYNGPIASLSGQLIMGDSATGSVWTINANQLLNTTVTLSAAALAVRNLDFTPDVGTISGVNSFLVTLDGRLLILDSDGEIFEVIATT